MIDSLRITAAAHVPTADQVSQIIQRRYLRGVARCHERALRGDAGALGRMQLRFKWRFGAPDQPSGAPVSIDVVAAVVLDAR